MAAPEKNEAVFSSSGLQLISLVVKGATPGPRKQTSAGQGVVNISVITETRERWEGQYAVVSSNAE